jgi:multidrug resistance efflux pump
VHRRLLGLLHAAWPFAGWLGAVGVAAYLYNGPASTGEAYAYADVIDVGVTPEISGVIAALPIQIGAEVRQGEAMLTLDSHDLEEQIRLAKADAERRPTDGTTGRRVEVVAGRNGTEARISGAPIDEGQSIRLEMDRLAVEQKTDRGELQALAPEIARLRGLVEKHLATPDRLETLAVQHAVLEKRVSARSDELRQLGTRLGSWADDVSKAGRLYVTELEKQRLKYSVAAPVSGRVEAILHHPGEWVPAGTAVAQILVRRPGRMTAYINERQTQSVHVGTRATLRVRSRASKVLGAKVIVVGPRIEEVPIRLRFIPTVVQWGQMVTLELDEPGEIMPGDIYAVRFHS